MNNVEVVRLLNASYMLSYQSHSGCPWGAASLCLPVFLTVCLSPPPCNPSCLFINYSPSIYLAFCMERQLDTKLIKLMNLQFLKSSVGRQVWEIIQIIHGQVPVYLEQ